MIQAIIISNVLMLLYPCAAFSMKMEEWVLIVIFTCIEIIPLGFILYMLFKELGTIEKIVRYFTKEKKRSPADTGATATDN